MELAAIIMAGVGVVIATFSWGEAHRSRKAAQGAARAADVSARAATEAVRLDGERRHEELAPEVRLEWDRLIERGGVHSEGVRVVNDGTMDYTEVEVELLQPVSGGRGAAVHIESLATNFVGPTGQRIPLGRLMAGGSIGLVIHPTMDEDGQARGGPVRLRFSFSTADGREWVQHHDTDVPTPPRIR